MSLLSGKSEDAVRRIRKDPTAIQKVLDTLDASASAGAGANARRAERFQYRVDSVEIEFANTSGGWDRHIVSTRNLSREGLGCVVGQFVYPGSVCRASLTADLYDHPQLVSGKVVRCRYLHGSGTLYEVGIRFDNPVDLPVFVRGAIDTRILLVDDEERIHTSLTRLLQSMRVTVVSARNGQEALQAAAQGAFDLILMDLQMPVLDGTAAAAKLRETGYLRPIVALAADDEAATSRACLESGFSASIGKPVVRARLEQLLQSLRQDPIMSALTPVRENAAVVDEFVAGLSDELHGMEAGFAGKDASAIRRHAVVLKGQATECGFAPIAEAAAALEASVADPPDLAAIREKLTLVYRLCLAVRSGSPGAGSHPAAKQTP